jgi:hypothetical protein
MALGVKGFIAKYFGIAAPQTWIFWTILIKLCGKIDHNMQMYISQWECCLSRFEGVLALGPKFFRIPPKPFWEFQWKLIQRKITIFRPICIYIKELCVCISLMPWIFLRYKICQAPTSIIHVGISSCNSSVVPYFVNDIKIVIPNSLYIKGECSQ